MSSYTLLATCSTACTKSDRCWTSAQLHLEMHLDKGIETGRIVAVEEHSESIASS